MSSAATRVAALVVMLAATGAAPISAGAATDALPELTRPVPPVLTPADPTLPIELDAAFSELDRRNNRLIFRQLNITQGSLTIQADEATADPADFENSVWIFLGNVHISNAGTQASRNAAVMYRTATG